MTGEYGRPPIALAGLLVNLCGHDPPTLQTDTDRQTDGQTTCTSLTVLCTVVHRAVKTWWFCIPAQKSKRRDSTDYITFRSYINQPLIITRYHSINTTNYHSHRIIYIVVMATTSLPQIKRKHRLVALIKHFMQLLTKLASNFFYIKLRWRHHCYDACLHYYRPTRPTRRSTA